MKKLIIFLIIPCFSFTQESIIDQLISNTTERGKLSSFSNYGFKYMPEEFLELPNLNLKIASYKKVSKFFELTIQATKPKDDGSFALFIQGYSWHRGYKIGDWGILMMSDKLNAFISALEKAKKKYNDWKEVAKRNNVRNFKKIMNIETHIALSACFNFFSPISPFEA